MNDYNKLLLILAILIAVDILTTGVAVYGYGAAELNPLSTYMGFDNFMIFKVGVSMMCIAGLHHIGSHINFLFVIIGIYIAVAIWNISELITLL